MALKAVITPQDHEALEEGLQGLYTQDGSKFVLDISEDGLKEHPGVGPLARAFEREKVDRKKLADTVAALQSKFDGLDPEAAREALAAMANAEDKELLDEGKVEELLAKKTARMQADFQQQLEAKEKALKEYTGQIEQLNGSLADITIYDAIKDAALTKGLRKEALPDIRNRAAGIWTIKDGKPVATKDGDTVFGKDGNPLTVSEWVDSMAVESAHLFEPNRGGGAQGNETGGGAGGIKQITKESAGANLAAIASGEAVIQR